MSVTGLTGDAFRSAGAQSGRLQAADARLHGGYALVEEYPTEVWPRFLYDQKAVAETVGVNPLVVAGRAATPLHSLVAGGTPVLP